MKSLTRDFDLFALPLITVLFIIRSAIPYTIYPFIGLIIIYAIYFVIVEKGVLNYLFGYVSRFRLYFIVFLFYLIGIPFTKTISFLLIKELFNALTLLAIGFFWYVVLKKYLSWKQVKKVFLLQYLFFALLAAIGGLLKFFLQSAGIKFSFLEYNELLQTTSLVSDHNFYALNLLIAIAICISLMSVKHVFYKRILLQISLLLLSFSVLLSGSRRGLVIIILGFLILLVYYIIFLFKKNSPILKRILINTFPSFIMFYFLTFSLILFFFFTSATFKVSVLDELNIYSDNLRIGISRTMTEYATIIDNDIDFVHVDRLIWGNKDALNLLNDYHSFFPETYHVVHPNFIEFPLLYSSHISEIYAGARFDYKSTTKLWNNPNTNKPLVYARYNLPELKVDSMTEYAANVWCYVSDSVDIDMARLEFPKSTFNGINRSYYDLSKKGVWQYLRVRFIADRDTTLRLAFFTAKYNSYSFNELKGAIIFANLKIKKDKVENFSCIDNTLKRKNLTDTTNIIDKTNEAFKSQIDLFEIKDTLIQPLPKKNIITKFFDVVLNNYKIRKGDNFYKEQRYLEAVKVYRKVLITDPFNEYVRQKIESCFKKNKFIQECLASWNQLNSLGNFKKEQTKGLKINNRNKILGDLIENSFYETDSSVSVISNSKVINESYSFNKLYGERTERWKYAFQIYFYEYSLIQKIFGNGFNYQKKFGIKFKKNDLVDYPHNIIISAFLYSGLIGGLFYLYFIIYVFRWFWLHKKKEFFIGMLTILAFTYSMVSSNSHFDSTILAIFTLIPFLLNDKYK